MRSAIRPVILCTIVAAVFGAGALAQRQASFTSADETRSALARALEERKSAEARALRLERAAASAGEAVERTAQQAAALAARVQESEAGIAAAEARLGLIDRQRGDLAKRLAIREKPIVRLTAALQRFSRRPLGLSVMRPGSVKEMVYLRAMLSATVPQVQQHTAALRGEIARGEALRREAQSALAALQTEERQLDDRRKQLAALEARQRIAVRQVAGQADREAERALALAEEARDLDGLVARLDQAGALREQLAALPGPIMRPPRPEQSLVVAAMPSPSSSAARRPPGGYLLPVSGRTTLGFGAPAGDGALSQGLSLVPRAGAQVVSPGPGRVAFAGPYRGYGRIAIIEHEGGWTSLVTGMARVDVTVGEQLVAGAPLGIAAQIRPLITFELRRNGVPVNPLDYL